MEPSSNKINRQLSLRTIESRRLGKIINNPHSISQRRAFKQECYTIPRNSMFQKMKMQQRHFFPKAKPEQTHLHNP